MRRTPSWAGPRAAPIDQIFSIAVGPSSGDPLQEIGSFAAIKVAMNFTDGDQVSFSVKGDSPEAVYLDELASDVWLLGPIEQRFRVTQLDQSWDADGGDEVTVTAVSYKRLLNVRLVGVGGLTYTQVDQGDILWNLIAHTQARTGGSWGITKGAATTGVLRDRTYVEGDNIGDLAQKLQDVIDGMWWDIDVDRVYNARRRSSFALQAQPVDLGGNARGLQRRSGAAKFGNVVYADGNKETTTPVWREAAGLATDPRGRWEVAKGFPTTELQATLIESAAGWLEEVLTPEGVWTVTMEPARWLLDSLYLPGDYVTIVVPRSLAAPIGPLPLTVVGQVDDMQIEFSADGAVSVQFTVVETQDADL